MTAPVRLATQRIGREDVNGPFARTHAEPQLVMRPFEGFDDGGRASSPERGHMLHRFR